MNGGEFLTRLSVWLAIAGYAAGAAMRIVAVGRAQMIERARWAWTIGCAFFLAHVVCAFAFYHQWSHSMAHRETARQTVELTGWHWGGGLYFNYAFAVAWLSDVLWWWCQPVRFARRPPWLEGLWQGVFFFMVLNGTIVFGRGPVRWLGMLVCGGLAGLWWWQRRPPVAARAPRT